MKINSRVGQFIFFLIAFIAMWNVCDFIASTFITHSDFGFTFVDNIGKPAGYGTIIGPILYFIPGLTKKK